MSAIDIYPRSALPTFKRESGVILIVALVMLLIMTVTGVTTMTGATLQERIAGNQRQKLVARSNADAALRVAEAYLDSKQPNGHMTSSELNLDFFGGGVIDSDGLYTTNPITHGGVVNAPAFDRVNGDWTVDNSIAVPDEANVSGRYIIEYMGRFDPNGFGGSKDYKKENSSEAGFRRVFRITALGFGNDNNVISILESYYLEAGQQ